MTKRKAAGPVPASDRTIFRNGSRERPFTMICNTCLRDPDLSPVQLTVLAYMLSQPPTFRASLEQVAKLRGLGRDQVRQAVLGGKGKPGLIDLGYCLRRRSRNPATRQFEPWEYCFTDQRHMFASDMDFPQDMHSDTGPAPEFQGLAGGPAPESHALEIRALKKDCLSKNRSQQIPKPSTAQQAGGGVFVKGTDAGDALIPFDVPGESEERGFSMGAPATDAGTTDTEACAHGFHLSVYGAFDTLIAPAERAAAKQGTLRGQARAAPLPGPLAARDWLPFSARVFARIRKLMVDPEQLVLRYLAKTKGEKIDNPDAYLWAMALDMAARRRGVDVATVTAEAATFRQREAAALADEEIRPKQPARASPALRAMLATGRGRT